MAEPTLEFHEPLLAELARVQPEGGWVALERHEALPDHEKEVSIALPGHSSHRWPQAQGSSHSGADVVDFPFTEPKDDVRGVSDVLGDQGGFKARDGLAFDIQILGVGMAYDRMTLLANREFQVAVVSLI